MADNVTVGSYLRSSREKQKLSLDKVAANLSVSKMYLSQIERDDKVPSDHVLGQIAEVYGVDEVYLFELAGKVPIPTREALKEHKQIQRLIAKIQIEEVDCEVKNRMYNEIETILTRYLKEEITSGDRNT